MYTKPLEFAEYPQITKLAADTLVEPDFLCQRWRVSKSHLGNLRREQRALPFIRLPLAKRGKGAVRYRMSDILAAEAAGVLGALNLQRVLLAVETCPALSAEQIAALSKHLQKELDR